MADDYEERVTAFVDILGFADLVSGSANDPVKFRVLHSTLETVQASRPPWDDPEQERKFWMITGGGPLSRTDHKKMFRELAERNRATVFSDSIVLSDLPDLSGIFFTFSSLCHLVQRLARTATLVRGGITIGPLFHRESMVFGPALVEAYKIESQVAVYPRIVIAENIVKMLDANASIYGIDVRTLMQRDYDGLWCLDSLGVAAFNAVDPVGDVNAFFVDAGASINERISTLSERSLGVQAKWRYFHRYLLEKSAESE